MIKHHNHSIVLQRSGVAILATSLLLLSWAWFFGPRQTITIDTVSIRESLPVVFTSLSRGIFDLNVPVDNYLVTEFFRGSRVQLQPQWAIGMLVVFALAVCLLYAIATFFSRFWFLITSTVLIGLLISLQPDRLLLFGTSDNTALIVLLVLFPGIGYLLHVNLVNLNLAGRIGCMAGMGVMAAVIIHTGAHLDHPFFQLAQQAQISILLIAILFIILIAHETIAFFLKIVTRYNTFSSTQSLTHFSVVTFFYLLALLLRYLYNTRTISWDLVYLDAFVVLGASVVLGYRGFTDRDEQHHHIIRFRQHQQLWYVGLAAISLFACAWFFISANDPLQEVMEDAIIFSHLGFGFIFWVYVIANFYTLLRLNKAVYQVVYRPRLMPYATFRIVGAIAMLGFLANTSFFPYYQSFAGYYNGIGDAALYRNRLFEAEQYYKLGRQYQINNHRSNYSLASLAERQGDDATAVYYYREARQKPQAEDFLNLAEIYRLKGRFFDALFEIREGLQLLPDHPALLNNLGMLYSRTTVYDSAFIFLKKAQEQPLAEAPATANLLGVLAKSKSEVVLQDVESTMVPTPEYPAAKNNLLVLANQLRETSSASLQPDAYLQDSVLNRVSFSYLYNYALFQPASEKLLNRFREFRATRQNESLYEPLDFSIALLNYRLNHVQTAFRQMKMLAQYSSEKGGFYYHLLGVWSLEQGAPRLAVDFFTQAQSNRYPEADLNRGIAWLEAAGFSGKWMNQAEAYWKELSADSLYLTVTDTVNSLFSYGPQEVLDKGEGTRYQYLRMYGNTLDSSSYNLLLSSYEGNSRQYIETELRNRFYQHAEGGQTLVADSLSHLITSELLTEDQLNLLWENPFYEKGILKAIEFERRSNTDVFSTYEKLLESLRLNPYSSVLNKAYILQCGLLGFENYAEEVLADYQALVSSARYEETYNAYQELLKESGSNF